MRPRPLNLALVIAAVAVAGVLFVVLRDDDDGSESSAPAPTTRAEQPAPEPEPATIVVEGGQPVGGVQELEFEQGGRIHFVVESDVADEVHLHGYDVAKDVEAGGSVEFDVPATTEGVFEVELESSAVQLAEISVTPA